MIKSAWAIVLSLALLTIWGCSSPLSPSLSTGANSKALAAGYTTLTANANQMLVCAENAGANPLTANKAVVGDWESFTLVNNADGTISLRSKINNLYVSADLNQSAKLIARSATIDTWEKFTKVAQPDGSFALLALANNQYVCTDLNLGAVLYANRAAVGGAWETFIITTAAITPSPTPTPTPTPTTSPVAGTPYGGANRVIADGAIIQAEEYNLGGEGVAYHDSDTVNSGTAFRNDGVDISVTGDTNGAYNIGWIVDGEWLNYTVNATAGTYSITARLASNGTTIGSLQVLLDGSVLGTIAATATGDWQSYVDRTISGISIPAGNNHVLQIKAVGGSFNLNYLKFTLGSVVTPTPSPGSGQTMEVMTWVPGYNQSTWKSALESTWGGSYYPKNTLTRVAAQFFQVHANGTVTQGVADSDVQWVVNYTTANGIKFLVCIHNYDNGGTNNWNWGMSATAFGANRTTLVNNIVALMNKWGANGVDIDFEGNEAGDPNRTEFATFIKELGARLHSLGKELTVDVFPNAWNQPNSNWWADWKGYVDGVNSMGYDALSGGGTGEAWSTYRWQQDTALNAGYQGFQFQMGMPAWVDNWGAGGLGTGVLAHVNELLSGNYNRYPSSVAIWDAQFNSAGWQNPQVWEGLHKIKMTKAN